MVSTSFRRIFSNLNIAHKTIIFAPQNNNFLVNFEVKTLFFSGKASFITICAKISEVYNFQSRDVSRSLEVNLEFFYPDLTWSYLFWSLIRLPSIYIHRCTSVDLNVFWSINSPMIPEIRDNVCNFGIWRKQLF